MGQTEDDYVVVREEDIADGIACFMATYLSSLKQTKVHNNIHLCPCSFYVSSCFSCELTYADECYLCVGYIT